MEKNMKHKLSYLLFFILFFSIQAFGQEHLITINKKNVPLSAVLNELEKQTSMSFVYNINDIKTDQKVSISVSQQPLTKVMIQLFSGTGITYTIVENHIVLSVKSESDQNDQSKRTSAKYKGVVTDVKGEPLIDVSVSIKGTGKGVVTGIDGDFELLAAKGDILEFSYVGFDSQMITLDIVESLTITMSEKSEVLSEVVVTAMGIKRQEKALAYNIQQITNDDLTTVKDANFMNSLVGKVAGVTINSSAAGAGSAARVVMRGVKSLTGSNSALYVIDGIPMFETGKDNGGLFASQAGADPIADLNPEDIESVNMLTGPSAAALYGSAAAAGVVLINTKKGQEDKTSFTYSNNTTFSMPYLKPNMQNSYVNVTEQLESWGERKKSNYDPFDFFNTSANIINAVTFSTGTSKNQTFASAAATNSTGILPNTKYNRYNFSIRNTANFLQDKLTLDLGASYINQNDRNMTGQGQYQNPLLPLYLFPRGDEFSEIQNFERFDERRDFYDQYWPYTNAGISLQNPFWIVNRNVRENTKKRYMFNATLKYQVLDWLNVTGRVRVDNSTNRYTYKKYAGTDLLFAGSAGGYDDIQTTDGSTYGDIMANIDKRIDDWTLAANVGMSINDSRSETIGHSGYLKSANLFSVLNLDHETKFKPKQWNSIIQEKALFANLELGWKSMLYLTLTGRNDWPSQLAGSKESSFFYPSVGVSGVISEMVKMPDWVSFLKLRGSFSEVGTSFAARLPNPTYAYSEESRDYATLSKYPLYDLRPEKTLSWEIGVNARFFQKISLDVTYYKSNTKNQTFQIPLGSSSGWESVYVQSGDIQNQGIEMSVGYNDKWGDFRYSTNYNFTWNQNKIKRLANGVKNPVTGEPILMENWEQSNFGNLDAKIILTQGGTLGDVYAQHLIATDSNGDVWVDPQSGAIKMEQLKLTEHKLGSILPKINMGWNHTFGYKDIELGVTFSGRIGGIVLSGTEALLDQYGISQRTADSRDNGGVPINYGKLDSKTYYQTISGYGAYYTFSATNFRLQELSLSYNLPKEWFQSKMRMTVELVGKNLWMIYCKAPFDPELSASKSNNYYQGYDYFMLPSTRNIGFNIKLQF